MSLVRQLGPADVVEVSLYCTRCGTSITPYPIEIEGVVKKFEICHCGNELLNEDRQKWEVIQSWARGEFGTFKMGINITLDGQPRAAVAPPVRTPE